MAAKKKTAKKKSKKKRMRKAKGTEMVSMEELIAQMENEAGEDSARTGDVAGNLLSIKGGEFTYQGADLGDELEVVILNFVSEKAWYDRPWNEDEPSAPACWAQSFGKPSELEVTEDVPVQQCDDCNSCWANEFGSAANGSGKACTDMRKCALVLADQLGASEDEVETVILKTPSASIKNFDKFIKGIAKVIKRPSYGVIARISFDDSVDYPKLNFTVVEPINDPAHLQQVMQLREVCTAELEHTYNIEDYVEPPKKNPRGKKKTSKKKGVKKRR